MKIIHLDILCRVPIINYFLVYLLVSCKDPFASRPVVLFCLFFHITPKGKFLNIDVVI